MTQYNIATTAFTVLKTDLVSSIGIKVVRKTSLLSWGEFGLLWNSCVVISTPAVALKKAESKKLSQLLSKRYHGTLMPHVTVMWHRRRFKSDKISNRHALLQLSHRSVCVEHCMKSNHTYCLFSNRCSNTPPSAIGWTNRWPRPKLTSLAEPVLLCWANRDGKINRTKFWKQSTVCKCFWNQSNSLLLIIPAH